VCLEDGATASFEVLVHLKGTHSNASQKAVMFILKLFAKMFLMAGVVCASVRLEKMGN
jgi:hypothetical protein